MGLLKSIMELGYSIDIIPSKYKGWYIITIHSLMGFDTKTDTLNVEFERCEGLEKALQIVYRYVKWKEV